MFKPGNEAREQYHVTLHFQDEKLVKIDNKMLSQEQPQNRNDTE